MRDPIKVTTNAALPKQFLVTQTQLIPPPDWRQMALGSYYLYLAPGVGATRIQYLADQAGSETVVLGWFGLGEAFFPDRNDCPLQLDGSVDEVYPIMTGRFVVLSHDGKQLSCTSDAGAQFPVVFRKETRELASTPLLLGWTKPLATSPQMASSFSRADGTVWFPFGTTPYSGIERLLPQQRLLLDGSSARLADWHPLNSDVLSVTQMYRRASKLIKALDNSLFDMECHLTAGWDSRMVLAASWPLKNRINYLTYLAAGNTARVDNEVAELIARQFNLSHRSHTVSKPSEAAIDQWLERTSYCVRDSVTGLTETIRATYTGRFGLSGVGGEVGRAFYWNKKDIGVEGITAEQLLSRLGFDKTHYAIHLAERWLESFRGQPRSRVLDQAYIDIRLGCWAGPSLCGHLVDRPTLSPFNNLAIYQSMLALPETYRLSGAFGRDFISHASPALARIPVNRLVGFRRLQNLPREAARALPKGAKAHLRKLWYSFSLN